MRSRVAPERSRKERRRPAAGRGEASPPSPASPFASPPPARVRLSLVRSRCSRPEAGRRRSLRERSGA
ncbi:MAG: hypothetical protein LBI02_07035, partial [Opitutaceae bacterium]|nr:hypothetical protein [Opitutaceae bacterium]